MPRGLVTYAKNDSTICYRILSCTSGEIQPWLKDGEVVCGKPCKCPEWANGCSHYYGPGTLNSTVDDEETKSLLATLHPTFCARAQTIPLPEDCEKEEVTRHFSQVQLYDNSTHLVSNLQLVYKQELLDEPLCYGQGNVTGSSIYCSKHPCAPAGKRFCYYPENEVVHLHAGESMVAIQAWGEVSMRVHEHFSRGKPKDECPNCTLQCILGGAQLTGAHQLGPIEMCAEGTDYCYQVEKSRHHQEFIFPPEVSLSEQRYVARVYARGYLIRHIAIRCPASSVCALLDCYFCRVRLLNWQCYQWWMLVIAGIIIYVLSSVIIAVSHVGQALAIVIRTLGALCQLVGFPIRKLQWLTRVLPLRILGKLLKYAILAPYLIISYPLRWIFRRNRSNKYSLAPARRGQPSMFLALLGILALLGGVRTCADFASLTGESQHCMVGEDGLQHCEFYSSTYLNIQPRGQKFCMLLKDSERKAIGALEFKVLSHRLRCRPITEILTRDVDILTTYAWRCRLAGSCEEDTCEKLSGNATVSEFTGEITQLRGHSKCTRVQGDISQGCLLHAKACLFTRFAVKPRDADVYEVFNCALLDVMLDLELTITKGELSDRHVMTLNPGETVKLHNMTLTHVTSSTPISPLLMQAKFITNGRQTAFFHEENKIRVLCPNKTAASRLDCTVPEDTCSYEEKGQAANFHCHNLNLEKMLSGDNLLPKRIGELFVERSNDHGIEINLPTYGSQLLIELNGLNLARKVDNASCEVTATPLKGCYNCAHGLPIDFHCVSTFGQPVAYVDCGDVGATLLCNRTGVLQREHFHFSHSYIHRNCTAQCPGGHHSTPARQYGWERAKELFWEAVDWARAHYQELIAAAVVLICGLGLGYLVVALAPLLLGVWCQRRAT